MGLPGAPVSFRLAFQEPICLSRVAPPWSSQPSPPLACLHCWNPCLHLSCPPPHPALSYGQATHMELLSSPSFAGPALSQGLRDFTPLNSLQFVSITPMLGDVQLHGGLQRRGGRLGDCNGCPAPQAPLTSGRGGHCQCLSASLFPSGLCRALRCWRAGVVTSVQSAKASEPFQYGKPKGSDLVPAVRVWQTSKGGHITNNSNNNTLTAFTLWQALS